MSGKGNRDVGKFSKNLEVTSKCLALILTPTKKEQIENEIPISSSGDRENIKESDPLCSSNQISNGKGIFEDFKLRNRTCYWNPALVESIKSLEYLGFVEPCTVLISGTDIHLENLRTAWGRRVLKDPENYQIERIGDVNGIEMQVIPQTQFIPLPEALCLIILDLNTHQIVATLDTIREKLHQYYKEMQAPSDQLIYDTLGNLIRERKVFHTGSGYFVVTPETYRLPTDDPRVSYHTTWMHYHPMYIPVFPQSRAPMKTISCQTSCLEEPPVAPTVQKTELETIPEKGKAKLFRSQSVKKSKDKPSIKECSDGEFKRTSSLRFKEKSKGAVKDINLKTSNINQDKDKGQKTSLLSKIFGRNKKKAPPPENTVEHATFSAQFPPPEWMWYQQQTERHKRTEEWVNQQMAKSSTWHFLQQVPGSELQNAQRTAHAEPQKAMTLPAGTVPIQKHIHDHQATHHGTESKVRSSRVHREHHVKVKHVSKRSEHREANDTNFHRFYTGSILPTDPNVTQVTAVREPLPIYTSTPRGLDAVPQTRHDNTVIQGDAQYTQEFAYPQPVHYRRSHRSRRKSNRHSYSHFTGQDGNDISVEYKGFVLNKHASHALSRDSGVNCIGLEAGSSSHNSKEKPSGQSKMDRAKNRHSAVLEDDEKENDRIKSSYRKKNLHRHRHYTSQQHGHFKTDKQIYEIDYKIDENLVEQSCQNENECQVESSIKHVGLPEIVVDAKPLLSNEFSQKDQPTTTTLDTTVEDSEHSSGTVIAIKALVHQPLDSIVQDTKDLYLGDSGFCSPRNDDNPSDKKQTKSLEESVFKGIEKVDDDCTNSGSIHVPNNRNSASESTLLNNVKCIKDNNLLQHHYNQVYPSHHLHGNEDSHNDLRDYKEQISKKFNVSGDFEVVGVV